MQTDYEIHVRKLIDSPWINIEPIRIGSVPSGLGTPMTYILLEKQEEPILRVDIYLDRGYSAFEEVKIWGHWLFIGYGEAVHFVSIDNKIVKSYELPSYFGHLYFQNDYSDLGEDDFLLVATGSELLRFDRNAKIVWCAKHLGIDGVIVNDINIKKGIIFGEGQWDPPDGWVPFSIRFESAEVEGFEKKKRLKAAWEMLKNIIGGAIIGVVIGIVISVFMKKSFVQIILICAVSSAILFPVRYWHGHKQS